MFDHIYHFGLMVAAFIDGPEEVRVESTS